ncbi:ABC-ATPase domain-containing protein [Nesterenkonia natronophila]|uniref:ATPase n=1 Tax=Nesterenkonia natronophila TaxID=2174932 RepID=A0A3A4FBY8_9MICC|nr:ABC-ATPase domain-containing protein [Nesterenkonia natronophila]RJN32314.1 ATPase [Nesterenkonia natronophila]
MTDRSALERTLHTLDGRGYGGYKQIAGVHRLGAFTLSVDKVQVDPFAPPSLMRISISREAADLPEHLVADRAGRIAVGDYITRAFDEAARSRSAQPEDGRKGPVSIGAPGQQVLERSSVQISPETVEARIAVELPAAGRKALGKKAARLLTQELPEIAAAALLHTSLNSQALEHHVRLYRDQEYLRGELTEEGLVAFVGDGSTLARRSGNSDRPLEHGVVEFASPDSMRTRFTLPSGRQVTGMGVPEGVTVIVGGGYHGKSTLLRAIERGVYPHIAGDGREWVITRPEAVSIRAEDGRAVTGVDISPFISGLPSGTDTAAFSTTNASGSTSQAANLVEAVEAGASALLIDEDTSATNFMIRDERMRQLIPADREPITPFVERVRPLFTERGVSTVLVAGGSGAFFEVADQVIALQDYALQDVTERARSIAAEHATASASPGNSEDSSSSTPTFPPARGRALRTGSLRPSGKTKSARAKGRDTVQFGKELIDLAALAQVVDPAQTEAIAKIMDRLAEAADGAQELSTLVVEILNQVEEHGLDVLSPHRGHPGHLARPRAHEVHAAVNRYRGLTLA